MRSSGAFDALAQVASLRERRLRGEVEEMRHQQGVLEDLIEAQNGRQERVALECRQQLQAMSGGIGEHRDALQMRRQRHGWFVQRLETMDAEARDLAERARQLSAQLANRQQQLLKLGERTRMLEDQCSQLRAEDRRHRNRIEEED